MSSFSAAIRTPVITRVPAIQLERLVVEAIRAKAQPDSYERSRRDRKKVEMLFAHLKRILRLDRLRLRGPRGAQFEFTLAAIAQNLRRLAKIVSRSPPAIVLGAA